MNRKEAFVVVAITTSNGGPFYVDAELVDTPLTYTWTDGATATFSVSDYTWRWKQGTSALYACAKVRTNKKQRCILAHRLLSQAPASLVVDHADRDTANNTLRNLRITTPTLNSANRIKRRSGKLPFKGLEERNGLYQGRVTMNGKRIRSPWFATAEEAARWYDRHALKLFGEFARLNFPEKAAANG